ncbi:MAG: Chk1 protein kinase [Cirrosporium novae-zelandiae]|nr:MAG: Chk1 protein kinase [Cirrosporium novae-zelandiae]
MIPHSQLAPLPTQLPFKIISKTIGQGAYACIKKARPIDQPQPIFAVKFIHKEYALRNGRLPKKQLDLEVTLHKYVGFHDNIIQFFDSGEDNTWRWVAMELAEGGDLFDKIEADSGVPEDIAHLYFTQLISAISYMHSKGVGHRDLKPENILLSADGMLKIADFGLATLFFYHGKRKLCTTLCGSPPYIAPEVIAGSADKQRRKAGTGYAADLVDIWSCGVILFVLLVGNTPWDEPTNQSYEFTEYIRSNGRPKGDELWEKLPADALSLLRGMMKVDVDARFSLEDVRRHPWFTRKNRYLSDDGRLTDPISLATTMFESLRVSLDKEPDKTAHPDQMEIESSPDWTKKFSSTQPETPSNDIMFDWERPPRLAATEGFSTSQPVDNPNGRRSTWDSSLADDPTFSQFSQTPSVPISRTQLARRFRDILPSHTFTRFYSLWNFNLLLPLLTEALHRLGVPVAEVPISALEGEDDTTWIKVFTHDGRGCLLRGDILIERIHGDGGDLSEVTFNKSKGDPVEWRRFFKKVAVLCKDGVYTPES